jgi:hypothetical protein
MIFIVHLYSQKTINMIKKSMLTLASLAIIGSLSAQQQPLNPGFENWGNPSPGVSSEPTGWYSNKSGSNTAQLGPQTCYKVTTNPHSGSFCVSVQTTSISIPFVGTEYINGNVTTAVVNAPSTSKCDGYLGTINYSSSSDLRRQAFTGRPDSLVGWFKYTPANSNEQAKIRAILHTGDYNDPENLTALQALQNGNNTCTSIGTSHPDLSANKIGDAMYLSTPGVTTSTWTRFAVPFTYVNSNTPAYIMINVTSSANQNTQVAGSILYLDDIAVIYNASLGINEVNKNESLTAYCVDKTFRVDFLNRSENQSSLEIFDISGKLVASQKITENGLTTIDMSGFNNGIYIYSLRGANYTKIGKFIIE